MKKIKWITVASVLVATLSFSEETPVELRLPKSWYNVETPPFQNSLLSTESEPSSSFTESTNKLFDANALAMEKLTEPTVDPKPHWGLRVIVQDLAVSGQGVLGMLVMKGTSAITLLWKPHGHLPGKAVAASTASDSSINSVVDFSDLSQEKLEPALAPVINTAIASGKIQNTDNFRKNLLAKGGEFLRLASAMENMTSGTWSVSKLRLDLSVSATGTVSHGFTVGGALKLRFDWMPARHRSRPNAVAQSDFGQKVKAFLLMLTADLNTIPVDLLKPAGFDVDTWKFGIGLTAKGDVAIVKGSAGILGYVYLKRSLLPGQQNPVTIQKIDSTIPYQRRLFQKGLRKALHMAAYFAERTETSNPRKWGVYQIKAAYTLTASGLISLATVAGNSEAEVTLNKAQF